MRALAVVSGLPWLVGAALLVGALWIDVRLWGPADSIIMDVSRGQGPDVPAAMTRTEYGRFGYLSTGSAIYLDRDAVPQGRPSKPERVETRRAIHWVGLLETMAISVLLIAAVIIPPLWVHGYMRRWHTGPPNNRWRGP